MVTLLLNCVVLLAAIGTGYLFFRAGKRSLRNARDREMIPAVIFGATLFFTASVEKAGGGERTFLWGLLFGLGLLIGALIVTFRYPKLVSNPQEEAVTV